MSVTSWDIAQEELYQNCTENPRDEEEFCQGCPFVERYPATLVTPAEDVCPWDFEPSECPRAGEWAEKEE
jgi:hypothetical protein